MYSTLFRYYIQKKSHVIDDTVETGNDLYNTAVRLGLILFSKDIGAF